MKRELHMNLKVFIEEVEKRPTLWSNKHKQDKFRRAQNWMDLVRTLNKDKWDAWSKEEKDEMIEYAQKKWRSIRDNIVKQVRRQEKTKLGCAQQRKASYVYYDICRFLLPEIPAYGRSFVWMKINKHIQTAEKQKQQQQIKTTASSSSSSSSSSSDDVDDAHDPLALYDKSDIDDSPSCHYGPPKKDTIKAESAAANKTKPPPAKKAKLKSCLLGEPSRVSGGSSEQWPVLPSSSSKQTLIKDGGALSEDEAFFLSLLPSVQKLADEQKMEFRIAVLKLLKNLKQSASNNCTNAIVKELFDL